MQCPHCPGPMKPYGTISYPDAQGTRLVDWAQCSGCGHAGVAETHWLPKTALAALGSPSQVPVLPTTRPLARA